MSVLVAAVLDAAVGEPPPRAHPVVWTGSYLRSIGAAVPATPARRAAVAGGAAWAVGAAAAIAGGMAVSAVTDRLPRRWRSPVRGAALWPLLSSRLLFAEVDNVERALTNGVEEGRVALSRIVSRDTSSLTAPEVRAAALESLSENLSDSLVAPLFWYVVGGLPAAAGYRFANTADACWGYRSPRWEAAGQVAARADDLLNLLPARLTALLLRPGGSWRRLRKEARQTPSPNAGWPMAALALRLDVRLTKPGTYVLNASGREPVSADTDRALWLARRAALTAVLLGALAEQVRKRRTGGQT